jgi:hypothetical protein
MCKSNGWHCASWLVHQVQCSSGDDGHGAMMVALVGGPMVVDGEGSEATVIAVDTPSITHQSLPQLGHGNPHHGGGSGSRSPQLPFLAFPLHYTRMA